MPNTSETKSPTRVFTSTMRALVAMSVVTIAVVFVLGNFGLSFELKAGIGAGLLAIYLATAAALYFSQRTKLEPPTESRTTIFTDAIETKLLILEEANEFFGTSLKFSDMFRFVASRIADIVPFATAVIYLRGSDGHVLELKYAVGDNAARFLDCRVDPNKGLAIKSLLSGRVQFDPNLLYERRAFPADVIAGLESAAALPLSSDGEVFGAIVLFGRGDAVMDERLTDLLTAISVRVAPLFASSSAFESNAASALTDQLTNLPNERGFFLVLENQLAESLRHRDSRPLSILAMDVRGFDEINKQFGHATGDRLLTFAAEHIKRQLRQMDVLTRSSADEFLAVLPTASERVCQEVIERVKRVFVLRQFEVEPGRLINLEISFGSATFWRDGETADHLVKTARIKKRQSKQPEENKVIFFPKEFVN